MRNVKDSNGYNEGARGLQSQHHLGYRRVHGRWLVSHTHGVIRSTNDQSQIGGECHRAVELRCLYFGRPQLALAEIQVAKAGLYRPQLRGDPVAPWQRAISGNRVSDPLRHTVSQHGEPFPRMATQEPRRLTGPQAMGILSLDHSTMMGSESVPTPLMVALITTGPAEAGTVMPKLVLVWPVPMVTDTGKMTEGLSLPTATPRSVGAGLETVTVQSKLAPSVALSGQLKLRLRLTACVVTTAPGVFFDADGLTEGEAEVDSAAEGATEGAAVLTTGTGRGLRVGSVVPGSCWRPSRMTAVVVMTMTRTPVVTARPT